MGTRISDLQVTKVVDGDTIKVLLGDAEESLRLACVDTEESLPGGGKPVTEAGKAASAVAKEYFAREGRLVTVELEFDTDDPAAVCKEMHRDNYGRLLCYVHKGGENYNLKLVREGWSPYFVKYGRSRVYHAEFTALEADAQAGNGPIWDPSYNAGGQSRAYDALVPWWGLRALAVEDYRRLARPALVPSVRLDYAQLQQAAAAGREATVLCDLQGGVNRWAGGGAVIYAGSVHHKFNLWIPDATSDESVRILRLIETRYAGEGKRGYAYVTGPASEYGGKPQVEFTSPSQIADIPPRR